MVLVTRLVIMLLDVLALLLDSPCFGMTFVLHSFVNREGWNANPRQTEMIGPVEVPGLGPRIGPNGQTQLFGHCLNRGIKRCPLGTGYFYFFRRAQRLDIVIIQIERDLPRRDRGMFAK